MALVKIATLSPALPVSDLLERLKALENSSGVSPTLAAEKQPPQYRPAAAVAAKTTPPPVTPRATVVDHKPAASKGESPSPPSAEPEWIGFVDFVRARKPMLATKLDKGSPLQFTRGAVQIAYPKGTLELSFLQEPDYISQLTELSAAFFGVPTTVRIVQLPENGAPAPLSIAEKKNLEKVVTEQSVKAAADSHPLMKAVLETFGGEVESYNT
jgi:DNA polymerase-3 subunit gamma/tau